MEEMRSTSRYCFTFGLGCFSWCSKKQELLAQSTIEVEFIASIAVANQAIWLKKLMDDLHVHQEDNQATLAISQDPAFHG